MERLAQPFIFTIFGASGDLAQLKIFPSLYDLMIQRRMPKEFYIIGYARTKKSRKEFQTDFKKSVLKYAQRDVNKNVLKKLLDHVYYFAGNYDDPKDYDRFKNFIQKMTRAKKLPHVLYFAVPPIAFKDIIKNLGEVKPTPKNDMRLVLEKPFGQNTKSANDLFHYVARYFKEDQIYLLDHYLGKDAVRSILNLRYSNRFLNLLMKGPEIANIQITAFEDIGVESRIGYFDQVGTLKDMIQSHLLQVLALITMSIPITEEVASLHREKVSILSALRFIKSKKNVATGQFESYRKIKGIKKNSKTETFAAVRLFIDRQSWYKVPIYIRTGKKLHEKHTYIVLELKKFAFQPKHEPPNRIVIELQPEERINIKLVNRVGRTSMYQDVWTSDTIACEGEGCFTEHGNLLLDVLCGRKMYFLSFPEILATWEITDSIVSFLKNNKISAHKYKDGSKGPTAQDKLTHIDGFEWFDIHR